MSEEQHWKRIFQYLFPGHPMPQSVYNDTTFSEEFLDFQDFISQPIGLDVLLTRVRENPCWTAEHEALFGPDIGQGLGQLVVLAVGGCKAGRVQSSGCRRNPYARVAGHTVVNSERSYPSDWFAAPRGACRSGEKGLILPC